MKHTARDLCCRWYGYVVHPVWVFSVLVAGGCALTSPQTLLNGGVMWQRHSAWVRSQPSWSLSGRFALNVGQRGWTASLRWHQRSHGYHIDIFDPLGRTLAQLDGSAKVVILRAVNRPQTQAASASALMQAQLGWSLPVSGLRYWVRGIQAPGSSPQQRRFDASGRLSELVQNGWHVQYLNYDNALGIQALPTRLKLSNGDVRLTLLIDHWQGAQ